ncbi:MAG TPA: glucose-6-phosphate dehydrogenase assembly protein OpcA [Solirubrobacteraceae bacterium]|nr:glucose-6-phosphate dehydrogenase assembly protein OpcA [Solirubrobacteraceae bacterium]
MSEDVWSASDTTPEAIDAALRELLRERHAADRTVAPARVLNLIVVVDRAWKGEIANRLERVGRYHASRTVLCAVEEGRVSLDARASMGYDAPGVGGVSVMREQVEIDMGPEHLKALDTIIDPVIVSELSTMLWCPHGHREAIVALRGMVDVMLLDSGDEDLAADGLREAAELQASAYVVDLAWLRTTPWRERLAASFDPSDRLRALDGLEAVEVRHREGSEASALLLAGWLCSRLGWKPEMGASFDDGPALISAAKPDGRDIQLRFEPSQQDAPGLAGVTVGCSGGFSLSLDRAPGGLRAREAAGDSERSWQILGASRGEGGILGEGVRQALLRDPTYAPSLHAALEMAG